MRKRKLYQLLAVLDEESIAQFTEFLSTPFFNTSKTLILFLGAWQKHVLGSSYDPEMSMETFLEGTNIQPARIDKLSTQLNQKLTEFLAFTEFQKQEQLQKQLFLKSLINRKMPISDLEWQYGRIAKRLDNQPASSDQLLHQLQLKMSLAEATVYTRNTRAIWQENFADLHLLLDGYYQLEKLKLSCASLNAIQMYNHKQESSAQIQPPAHIHILEHAQLPPLPRAYALILKIMDVDADENAFEELLEVLKTHATSFAHEEAYEVYAYVLNFCLRQLNKGRHEFRERTAALYRQLISNGLILTEGQLPPQRFKNIIALHCRIGHLDWVREFIDQEAEKLPPESAASAILYNKAVLSFHLKNYPDAIAQLKQVIANLRDDVFYGIDARVYLWRSYFESMDQLSIEEIDEMLRLYDAFRIFVERNDKISKAHKMDYRNFIRVFKKMVDLYSDRVDDREALENLRLEIQETSPLPNRGWLLEKVEATLGER